MSSLLLSPHDDDSTLFATFISLRERPLVAVITSSFIQPNRGERGCSADERAAETAAACKVLACPVVRLGLRDDGLTEEALRDGLKGFSGFEKVYAPAIQGGNWQHDLVGKVARELFPDCIQYTTYTKTELWTKGNLEIIPTPEEAQLKIEALKCYTSQIHLPSTRPHFEAVLGKSEWLIQ